MQIREKLPHYASLMRLDKPIGILLLLWPTLWALWLSAAGRPSYTLLWIFVAGAILMRSAGCIINDFADREFDGHVHRTRNRPLVTGKVKKREALLLASLLALIALFLVLKCNRLTIQLAFIAALLAGLYPFLKRVTHLPQLGLGIAFSFGIPMAFAAQTGSVHLSAWLLFGTAVIWPIIYDTMYAMVDRADDLQIGIKSTAILFNQKETRIIGLLQLLFLGMLMVIGQLFHLKKIYYISLLLAAILFLYQQYLIKDCAPKKCFQAFLNNNWLGLFIFLGILLSYL